MGPIDDNIQLVGESRKITCGERFLQEHYTNQLKFLETNVSWKDIEEKYQYFKTDKGKAFNISKLEFICLILLSEGMSCKRIAKHLPISHLAVEYRILSVKLKLNALTRYELIEKFRRLIERIE